MKYFLLLLLILPFYFSDNTKKLEHIFAALPADTILSISTYDGSGQVVHPDIYFENDTFYLALTPYPNYNDKVENPSVYISVDGINFSAPTKNPIAAAPPYDHNNDPDIFKTDSGFAMVYLKTMRPDSQCVMLLQSKNFKEWNEQTLLHYNLKKQEQFILSPSVLPTNDSFYLFYVNMNSVFQVEMLSAKSFLQWNKNKPEKISLPLSDGYMPWHVDITRWNDKFLIICCAEKPDDNYLNTSYRLYFFTGSDLRHWNYLKYLDCSQLPDKKCRYLYRSTGLVYNDTLSLWYSYVDSAQTWKIGFKKVDILK